MFYLSSSEIKSATETPGRFELKKTQTTMIFLTLNLNKMKYIRKRLMFVIYSDRSAPFKNYVHKLLLINMK